MSNNKEFSSLVSLLNKRITNARLIDSEDLWMLVQHAVLAEHITLSKAAELTGTSLKEMRTLAQCWKENADELCS